MKNFSTMIVVTVCLGLAYLIMADAYGWPTFLAK